MEFNCLKARATSRRQFTFYQAQANLVTKTDFDNKLSNLNRKITSNKTTHLLVENQLKKLETFDSAYFCGKSRFEDDATHNWLVFQPMHSILKQLLLMIVILYHGNLKIV